MNKATILKCLRWYYHSREEQAWANRFTCSMLGKHENEYFAHQNRARAILTELHAQKIEPMAYLNKYMGT